MHLLVLSQNISQYDFNETKLQIGVYGLLAVEKFLESLSYILEAKTKNETDLALK